MPRGGYQKPKKPAAVSGPGKFSKRTDGQAKKAPDLDTPGQQYGDRQMIEASQSVAPIPGGAGAEVRRPQGHAASGGRLPSFLFDSESSSPLEPATSGMDMGAGAGPEVLDASTPPEDEREMVLQFLAETFQNKDAVRMLNELRNERAGAVPPTRTVGGPTLDDQAVPTA